MKKKAIFFSIVLLGIAGSISSQKAFGYVEAKLHVNGCQTNDKDGNIVALGNTCSAGSSNCTSNPCP